MKLAYKVSNAPLDIMFLRFVYIVMTVQTSEYGSSHGSSLCIFKIRDAHVGFW